VLVTLARTRRGLSRDPEEAPGEADIPAEQAKTSEKARVPASDVDPGRPIDHQEPPTSGPTAARRLTWRITDRSTLVRLRREGRRVGRGSVTVWYLSAESPEHPRFAWAIGRKTGGAVVRNRLRRRLRSIVESRARSSTLDRGAYLVSLAPSAAEQSYEELKENVEAALRAVNSGSGAAAGRAPAPRPDPGGRR
jgi:ribonuclease P protein component